MRAVTVQTHADPWSPNEIWDLYDSERRPTGEFMRRGLNIPTGYYHIIVNSWIRNSAGEYLMSLRHPSKKLFGGKWECTGGCVLAGEDSLQGAVREAGEELGLTLDPDDGKLIYTKKREQWQDFYDAYLFHSDVAIDDLHLQDVEVADARWMSLDEIASMEREDLLYPLLTYYGDVLE